LYPGSQGVKEIDDDNHIANLAQ